jgi:DNA-binding transcriptional MerR regulator
MLIGSLAKSLDVSTKTLRHYERIGLIPKAERGANGYRTFAPHAVRRAQLVVSLRKLGLSLDDVGEILDADDGRSLRQRLLGRLDEQIAERDLSIAMMQGQRDELQARFDALIGTPRDRAGNCICGAMLTSCDCGHETGKSNAK